jgi:hypothetical protein
MPSTSILIVGAYENEAPSTSILNANDCKTRANFIEEIHKMNHIHLMNYSPTHICNGVGIANHSETLKKNA